VQAGRCRQCVAGSELHVVRCRQCVAGSLVQVVWCRQCGIGSVVQAVWCMQGVVPAVCCRQCVAASVVQAMRCRQGWCRQCRAVSVDKVVFAKPNQAITFRGGKREGLRHKGGRTLKYHVRIVQRTSMINKFFYSYKKVRKSHGIQIDEARKDIL
jgi:ribosomal protein L40E